MNIRIWNRISDRKRLREENESLRERIKALEKKEREMQFLNVNLKRENDNTIAQLKKKHTNKINALEQNIERNIEKSLKREQQLKQALEKKKQSLAHYCDKLLSAQGEIKELQHRIAQMETENRQKKKSHETNMQTGLRQRK
jgi:chromosome segregation ATPase